jgi:competence protein ComEA
MRSSSVPRPPQQRLNRALAATPESAAHGRGQGPPATHGNDRPPDDLVRTWVVDDAGAAADLSPPAHRRSISGRAAGFAAVLALAALLLAVPRAFSSGPEVQPVPPRRDPVPTASVSAAPGAVSISAPAATAAAGEVATAEPGSTVLVHVVGHVRHPGVVRLHAGARLGDALRKAGGATRRADLAAVNLARAVVDGEQVFVPAPGETPAAAPAAPPGTAAPGAPGVAGAVVDLNTADETRLDALPGVGPVIAGRIVAWRQEHGRFSSVDELTEVSGIGDATLERLRPLVRT